MAGLESAGSLSPVVKHVPYQMHVSYNSIEFKELLDQSQNTYRPYSDHCATRPFAPMSARSGESTIEETTEGRTSCPKLEIR
jgi:hypothetical protein